MSTRMDIHTTISRWPAFIISLALAFAIFTWWSLTRAASSVSPVTDSGYYQHGLEYNDTHHELLAAETMGWQILPQVNGRRLTIQVEDGRQAGVPGGRGFIAVQAEAGQPTPLPLTDAGQGRYTVDLPAGLPSTVAADLTLSKGQATLQRRLLIALGQ